jgi:hypothetical protein
MTRIMRDSTSAADIPADTPMVAGYVDGRYAWSAADWQRFPHAVRVGIAVHAWTNQGDVLDVEQGDATPAQAPGWVGARRAAGAVRPTIYCNRGNVGAVADALHAAGVDPAHCAIWLATLDGTVVDGVTAHGYEIAACQSRGAAQTGGHYDESIVFDDVWPGVATPDTGTIAPEDIDMVLVFDKDGSEWLLHGGRITQVVDPDFSNALLAAGVHRVPATPEQVEKLREAAGQP